MFGAESHLAASCDIDRRHDLLQRPLYLCSSCGPDPPPDSPTETVLPPQLLDQLRDGLRVLCGHLQVSLNTLLSNIFHFSLLRFIKHQDDKVSGLSEAAKIKRRHRNFVTMKFNLLSFVLEAASVILVALSRTFFIRLLYLLVNYCDTPLVQTTWVQTTPKIGNCDCIVCRCTTWVLRTTGGRLGNTSSYNLGSAGDQEGSHQHQHLNQLLQLLKWRINVVPTLFLTCVLYLSE